MLHSTTTRGVLSMISEIQAITTLIEESKLTEAKNKIDQALINLGYSPQLYCLAIQVSILLNNLKSAFTYANDAIKLFPDDPDILNNTARILLDFQKSTKSLRLFEKAIITIAINTIIDKGFNILDILSASFSFFFLKLIPKINGIPRIKPTTLNNSNGSKETVFNIWAVG